MYLGSSKIICYEQTKLVFFSNLGDDHWNALKRVMSYLIGNISYGKHYLNVLEGYSDSNWTSGANEIKALSEYMFTLGGGAIF